MTFFRKNNHMFRRLGLAGKISAALVMGVLLNNQAQAQFWNNWQWQLGCNSLQILGEMSPCPGETHWYRHNYTNNTQKPYTEHWEVHGGEIIVDGINRGRYYDYLCPAGVSCGTRQTIYVKWNNPMPADAWIYNAAGPLGFAGVCSNRSQKRYVAAKGTSGVGEITLSSPITCSGRNPTGTLIISGNDNIVDYSWQIQEPNWVFVGNNSGIISGSNLQSVSIRQINNLTSSVNVTLKMTTICGQQLTRNFSTNIVQQTPPLTGDLNIPQLDYLCFDTPNDYEIDPNLWFPHILSYGPVNIRPVQYHWQLLDENHSLILESYSASDIFRFKVPSGGYNKVYFKVRGQYTCGGWSNFLTSAEIDVNGSSSLNPPYPISLNGSTGFSCLNSGDQFISSPQIQAGFGDFEEYQWQLFIDETEIVNSQNENSFSPRILDQNSNEVYVFNTSSNTVNLNYNGYQKTFYLGLRAKYLCGAYSDWQLLPIEPLMLPDPLNGLELLSGNYCPDNRNEGLVRLDGAENGVSYNVEVEKFKNSAWVPRTMSTINFSAPFWEFTLKGTNESEANYEKVFIDATNQCGSISQEFRIDYVDNSIIPAIDLNQAWDEPSRTNCDWFLDFIAYVPNDQPGIIYYWEIIEDATGNMLYDGLVSSTFNPNAISAMSFEPKNKAIKIEWVDGYDVPLNSQNQRLLNFNVYREDCSNPIVLISGSLDKELPPYVGLCDEGEPDPISPNRAFVEHSDSISNMGYKYSNAPETMQELDLITVYPNPASTSLNINNNYSSKITRISVYTTSGREVLRKDLGSFEHIDIGSLSKGQYLIEVMYIDERRVIKSFIKSL